LRRRGTGRSLFSIFLDFKVFRASKSRTAANHDGPSFGNARGSHKKAIGETPPDGGASAARVSTLAPTQARDAKKKNASALSTARIAVDQPRQGPRIALRREVALLQAGSPAWPRSGRRFGAQTLNASAPPMIGQDREVAMPTSWCPKIRGSHRACGRPSLLANFGLIRRDRPKL